MKEITTNGIAILLVEVPEDVKAWSLKHHMDGTLRSLRVSDNESNYELCVLPSGQYQILGKSTELSEEQMKEICASIFGKYYFDYMNPENNNYAPGFTLYTVQESYLSMLEANGILDRNPYGDKPKRYIAFFHPGFMTDNDFERLEEYDIQLSKWQESQSKVKHYLVLKRI